MNEWWYISNLLGLNPGTSSHEMKQSLPQWINTQTALLLSGMDRYVMRNIQGTQEHSNAVTFIAYLPHTVTLPSLGSLASTYGGSSLTKIRSAMYTVFWNPQCFSIVCVECKGWPSTCLVLAFVSVAHNLLGWLLSDCCLSHAASRSELLYFLSFLPATSHVSKEKAPTAH